MYTAEAAKLLNNPQAQREAEKFSAPEQRE